MNEILRSTRILWLILLLVALSTLQGCGALFVAGAATGVGAAHDRRTVGVLVEDQNIELKAANMRIQDKEYSEQLAVSATSYNLRVLLTGQSRTPEAKQRYVSAVSHINQVRRVFDEIEVGEFASLRDKSEDAYITARVNLALLDVEVEGFDPSRINVTTERKIVYLMGLLTESEKQAALEAVRYVDGVQRVVDAIEIF